MNDVTKQILAGVITTIVTAVVIGIFAYVLIIKENQLKISHLETQLTQQSEIASKEIDKLGAKLDKLQESIDSNVDKSQSSIDALKLFVVAAHPQRNNGVLTSYNKLQNLNPLEFSTLSSGLHELKSVEPVNWNNVNIGGNFDSLINEHKINQDDLELFIKDLEISTPVNETEKP